MIRGFDQLVVPMRDGRFHVLISADAKLPYRTSVSVTDQLDGRAVAEALEKDFSVHGPPRYAPYYGQLERQTEEHRAWFEAA